MSNRKKKKITFQDEEENYLKPALKNLENSLTRLALVFLPLLQCPLLCRPQSRKGRKSHLRRRGNLDKL